MIANIEDSKFDELGIDLGDFCSVIVGWRGSSQVDPV